MRRVVGTAVVVAALLVSCSNPTTSPTPDGLLQSFVAAMREEGADVDETCAKAVFTGLSERVRGEIANGVDDNSDPEDLSTSAREGLDAAVECIVVASAPVTG